MQAMGTKRREVLLLFLTRALTFTVPKLAASTPLAVEHERGRSLRGQ
jgi:hypothetical protein